MPNNNSEFKNDWTLMFFFASDNPLAPLLVSQLKAIKDAGFQEHTEVLVYFDPMEKGCPTKMKNSDKWFAELRGCSSPSWGVVAER